MGQDEGRRVRASTRYPHEVNRYTIDVDELMVIGIHLRFHGTPVVRIAPVADQLLDVAPGRTVAAIGVTGIGGPAGSRESVPQVIEVALSNLDYEGL